MPDTFILKNWRIFFSAHHHLVRPMKRHRDAASTILVPGLLNLSSCGPRVLAASTRKPTILQYLFGTRLHVINYRCFDNAGDGEDVLSPAKNDTLLVNGNSNSNSNSRSVAITVEDGGNGNGSDEDVASLSVTSIVLIVAGITFIFLVVNATYNIFFRKIK